MAVGVSELDTLINSLDHDGLVRYVDGCCSSRDWDELLRVREKCRLANDSGRQMWPVTTLANFRLALHAPAEFAVRGLEQVSGSFLFGPLSEVIAQNHTWAELAPLLNDPYLADVIAHERELRSERTGRTFEGLVYDIPREPQTWEPHYLLPTYSDAGVQHDAPPIPSTSIDVESSTYWSLTGDLEAENALRAVVEPWIESSNGHAEIVTVDGTAPEALSALGVRRASLTPIDHHLALQWLAWAAASGGAHGRRRGVASARYATWWVLAALGGLAGDWPVSPSQLGEIAHQLQWWLWDAHEPQIGWRLQLIIEDPVDHLTWGINASDVGSQ